MWLIGDCLSGSAYNIQVCLEILEMDNGSIYPMGYIYECSNQLSKLIPEANKWIFPR